ncbi:hypothetical protein BX600DRAFT_438591 [Xylariales sp. PMI_506]|nr:hypothetical protein BX600DRAFT_438591 [Xylariales sp. PMI_506]
MMVDAEPSVASAPPLRTRSPKRPNGHRRGHTKSRQGCKPCKLRHIKCDEERPSCSNCVVRKHRCSYLDLVAATLPSSYRTTASSSSTPTIPSISAPSTVHPSSAPGVPLTPGSTGSLASSQPFTDTDTTYVTSPPSAFPSLSYTGQPEGPCFTILHLELLHHLHAHPAEILGYDNGQAQSMLDMNMSHAFRAPYLIDQFLSFTAMRMSILQPDRQNLFRAEAANLQNRALAQFNAQQRQVTEESFLPMFLFSGILNCCALYDALEVRSSFALFLDRLVEFLSLSRGIRAITAAGWWPSIEQHLKRCLGENYAPGIVNVADSPDSVGREGGSECDRLLQQLRAADMSQESISACCRATEMIQDMLDSQQTFGNLPNETLNAVLGWPNLVPREFIDMLKQRRPEALVVLAHFAILLYRAKDQWVFGDSAQYLITSTAEYLGTHWVQWMAVPLDVLALNTDT